MKKKISVTEAKARAVEAMAAAVRGAKPVGCVAAAAAAPIVPRPTPPTPTEEQATIAWKIVCSTPTFGELRKEAEEILRRYLKADLNPKPDVRTSGFAYIPGGGALTTTAGATTWAAGT